MDQGIDSLQRLALALGISPPDLGGLRAALVEGTSLVMWEHVDLPAQQPELVAAALVEAHAAGSQDLVSGILGFLSCVDGAPEVVSALVDRDETLALRCIPRLLNPHDSLTHVGALTTLRALAVQLVNDSGSAQPQWDVGTLWTWPPQQVWQLLLPADERSRRPAQDLDDLYVRVFEHAPASVFAHDPQGNDEHEAAADVQAHVLAFVEQAAAVDAAGGDTTAWIRWIGQHQRGCGEPSCCRLSRFEAELLRRGFHIRVGRTPWT